MFDGHLYIYLFVSIVNEKVRERKKGCGSILPRHFCRDNWGDTKTLGQAVCLLAEARKRCLPDTKWQCEQLDSDSRNSINFLLHVIIATVPRSKDNFTTLFQMY